MLRHGGWTFPMSHMLSIMMFLSTPKTMFIELEEREEHEQREKLLPSVNRTTFRLLNLSRNFWETLSLENLLMVSRIEMSLKPLRQPHLLSQEKETGDLVSKSLLDQIEGIGSIRKRALLNHFGSARSVESASLDEIKSVEGVEEKVAKKIYNFFHE